MLERILWLEVKEEEDLEELTQQQRQWSRNIDKFINHLTSFIHSSSSSLVSCTSETLCIRQWKGATCCDRQLCVQKFHSFSESLIYRMSNWVFFSRHLNKIFVNNFLKYFLTVQIRIKMLILNDSTRNLESRTEISFGYLPSRSCQVTFFSLQHEIIKIVELFWPSRHEAWLRYRSMSLWMKETSLAVYLGKGFSFYVCLCYEHEFIEILQRDFSQYWFLW